MKAYIASRLHDREKVRQLADQLKQLDIEITHDWTTHKNIRPYKNNLLLAEQYATADLEGIKDADVFIFLTQPEIGSGSAGELGAAIMLSICFGKPDIYVVGKHVEKNLFYYHPAVKRIDNSTLLLDKLAKKV